MEINDIIPLISRVLPSLFPYHIEIPRVSSICGGIAV